MAQPQFPMSTPTDEESTVIGDIPVNTSGGFSPSVPGEEIPADTSIKLFVGQVPRNMEEEDLQPVMDQFGTVESIVIIRDRMTAAHRGCAFVTYMNKEDAESAVAALHNKVTLPPSPNPLQVRPAEGHGVAVPEHKLFIGMIPKNAGEKEIRDVFDKFGEIEEVYILRHQSSGQSKGCAFLKYKEREEALAAIEQVHGIITMDGGSTPLVVKFADNRRQRMQRVRTQAASAASAAAAYWQMPPGMTMPFAQLQGMQQQYMQQMQAFGGQSPPVAGSPQNPAFMYYNPYAFPYGYPPGAAPAGNSTPYGGPAAPGREDESTVAASPPGTPTLQPMPGMAIPAIPTHIPSVAPGGLPEINSPVMKPPRSATQLEGPPGANLFIYHLPHDLTDADLATAFAPFGTVISAKVYMDKSTGESKGFGFVSYDSKPAADAAIASMNGFQIGSKRLKVQHKRVHNRDDLGEESVSSNGSIVDAGEYEEGADEKTRDFEGNALEQSVHSLRLDG